MFRHLINFLIPRNQLNAENGYKFLLRLIVTSFLQHHVQMKNASVLFRCLYFLTQCFYLLNRRKKGVNLSLSKRIVKIQCLHLKFFSLILFLNVSFCRSATILSFVLLCARPILPENAANSSPLLHGTLQEKGDKVYISLTNPRLLLSPLVSDDRPTSQSSVSRYQRYAPRNHTHRR